LLFIQCEKCKTEFSNCCSEECTDILHLPEDKQKELRRGKTHPYSNMLYRKGRLRPNGKQLQKYTLVR
jgi:UPF0176 protein